MSDDGILFGEKRDGPGILDSMRSKASLPPDVLVGPDSIAIMSFTSGSDGRPKCVLGHHHSLAKYYPWMAEQFNLKVDSKIACLSGIAHDPIRRGKTHHAPGLSLYVDILPPLVLSAHILIPAEERTQPREDDRPLSRDLFVLAEPLNLMLHRRMLFLN